MGEVGWGIGRRVGCFPALQDRPAGTWDKQQKRAAEDQSWDKPGGLLASIPDLERPFLLWLLRRRLSHRLKAGEQVVGLSPPEAEQVPAVLGTLSGPARWAPSCVRSPHGIQ